MFAFLDTPFDPDFPVYTRANAGEILPDPVPPLAWSLVGPCFEEGFRIAFCDDFGLLPRPGPDRPFQMVGRMAARLHLNLSVIRTTAQRLPAPRPTWSTSSTSATPWPAACPPTSPAPTTASTS